MGEGLAKEVGQIILKARELLSDPAKWCQTDLSVGGAMCLLGAVGGSLSYLAGSKIAGTVPGATNALHLVPSSVTISLHTLDIISRYITSPSHSYYLD